MTSPLDDPRPAAEEAVLAAAVARGLLTTSQAEAWRGWRRSNPAASASGVLAHLAARGTSPTDVEALRRVHAEALARGQPRGSGVGHRGSPDPTPGGPRLPGRLPAPGDVVAGHAIERELARGGMGAVYVARDPAGRQVALKLMLRDGSPDSRKRFEREARAAARVEHPGIVRVHELGADEAGRAFIAMELVDGESLADRLERGGPLEPREAARCVREAALALAAAHAQGVTHRDLKPHNLLIERDGRVRLTDFGVAKVSDQSEALSKTGQLLGTPAYMSPEQIAGRVHDTGAAADVYALGATLHALLTGAPPFEGLPPLALLAAILHEAPSPPSAARAGVPRALDRICRACLEKDPARRYPGMEALAADLEAFLAGRSLRRGGPARARAAGVAAIVMVAVLGLAALAAARRAQRRPLPRATDAAPPAQAPAADADDAPEALHERSFTRAIALAPEAEAFARPPARALALRLFAEGRPVWHLTLEDATPGDWELACRPRGGEATPARATGGGGADKALVLRAAGELALAPGVYELVVRGPPGGAATLRGRLLAVDEPLAPPPLVWDEPLPPLAGCLAPAAHAEAEALLRALEAALDGDAGRRDGPAAERAFEGLRALVAAHGTARGTLLLAAAHRRLAGNSIAAWREREGWLRPLGALDPQDLETCLYLGRLSDRLDEWELAIPLLERAKAAGGRHLGHLRAGLLRAYVATGRLEQARAEGLDLAARGADDPDTHRNLGRALLAGPTHDWRGVDHLVFAARRHSAVGRQFAVEDLAEALLAARAPEPEATARAARRAARRIADDLAADVGAARVTGATRARLEVALGLLEALGGELVAGRRRTWTALEALQARDPTLAGSPRALRLHEALEGLLPPDLRAGAPQNR